MTTATDICHSPCILGPKPPPTSPPPPPPPLWPLPLSLCLVPPLSFVGRKEIVVCLSDLAKRNALVCCRVSLAFLLLLLRSFSFFFCVPSFISGASSFCVSFFADVTVFNATIEVLHSVFVDGACWMCSYILPAFTRPGHECQDLFSPCDGMRVCTDQTSVYTLIRKSFG